MNLQFYNFVLFVIWVCVGVWLLVLGPKVNPNVFNLNTQQQMLGGGAIMLAVWNMIRWWMIRSDQKRRAASRAAYQSEVNPLKPLARKEDPKVTNPEFQFENPPPPPSQNGTAH